MPMRRNEEALRTLRELREARGLSLDAVALLAGVNAATVSRWERGVHTPTPEATVRLGKALGISVRRTRALLVGAGARHEPERAAAS